MASQDIQTTLYNGKHTVTFSAGNHRYVIDGKPCEGVTTIMSKVLAKPGLMLWPLNMALTHLRENSTKGITEELLQEAAQAHIKKRDKGASTGSVVHAVAERFLLDPATPAYKHMLAMGIDSDSPLYSDEALLALHSFEGWHGRVKPKTIAVEQVVYSSSLQYAGTFDSILQIDGKNYLCDLKTTNASKDAPAGIYPENFIQLAAYYHAYQEQRNFELFENGKSELVPIRDVMVISCKKDGQLDTLTGSEAGLSVADLTSLWISVLVLYDKLTFTKNKILGGKTP